MDFVKKNIKWIGVAGCAIAAIATFLPFVTVTVSLFGISSSQSIKFIDGDGIFVIIFAILAGFMLFGKTLNNFKIANIKLDWLVKFWWGSLVPLGLALGITIYDAINVDSVSASYGSYGASVSFGIGFYLILIGLIVAAASVLFEKFGMKVDNSAAVQTTYQSPVAASTTTYQSPVATSTTTYAQPTVQPAVEPVVQPTVEPTVQPVVEPVVQQPTQPATVTCPGCGSQVASGSKFCTTCGTSLQ